MVGIDGNVAELADMAVVVVAVVAAAEGQNSAQNENRDSLDYTSFQCELCIQLKPEIN